MAESSLASSRRQLAGMLDRCEDLLGQLNRREELLSEVRSLGGRIDQAYAAFESSPQTEADQLLLGQTQANLQAGIEPCDLKPMPSWPDGGIFTRRPAKRWSPWLSMRRRH